MPVTQARTLRVQADLNVNDQRISMLVGVALGSAALLLAAVGLFGAMSYSVARRTRELGVRLALGAIPLQIATLVLRRGLMLAAAGTFVGIWLGYGLGRLIEARLFGVAAGDPVSTVAAVVLLFAIALLASWLPARRAMQVDPVDALRMD